MQKQYNVVLFMALSFKYSFNEVGEFNHFGRKSNTSSFNSALHC